MSKFPVIARILLALYFIVFGLNGFFQFLPVPALDHSAHQAFDAIFMPAYQFPLVKGLEILCGMALLADRLTALALLILAIISVQIVLFQLTYMGFQHSVMQIVFTALLAYLMFTRKNQYVGILKV